MVILNREQAAKRAEASHSAKVGMCQQWTRDLFDAPSSGDVDGDGDADAVDGWKDETHRHAGDRNPPRGVPLAWSGGSSGHGHRAISLGGGKVRSIDVDGPGTVGTVDMDFFEDKWHLHYLGWSETISGHLIPEVEIELELPKPKPKPKPKPAPPKSKGPTKTLGQIAQEVIDGKWGNGADREKRLAAAGYHYPDVQKKVNKLLS